MTRVLILGGAGMLGHKAYQVAGEQFETWAAFRRYDDRLRSSGVFRDERVIDGVDALEFDSVIRAIEQARPDVVLNCIGIVKQRDSARDPKLAIYVNSLFPHLLHAACTGAGSRLIHISTDCVFSGTRGNYTEADVPDAADLYGRTKLLGEVDGPGAITLRTSIIGRELFGGPSLVEWFLSQRGTVRGFTHAIFSGLTTLALAREISRLITDFPGLQGVYQVAAARISKYDLLMRLRTAFDVECEIEAFGDFRCDRSLRGDHYAAATGFAADDWKTLIKDLASDPTPYDALEPAAARGR